MPRAKTLRGIPKSAERKAQNGWIPFIIIINVADRWRSSVSNGGGKQDERTLGPLETSNALISIWQVGYIRNVISNPWLLL